jgi:hypothetical protein
MGKRTKKVGICGKYGTRYGASIRKNIKKQEVSQHQKYNCVFCGKDTVKRKCVNRAWRQLGGEQGRAPGDDRGVDRLRLTAASP